MLVLQHQQDVFLAAKNSLSRPRNSAAVTAIAGNSNDLLRPFKKSL